MVKLNWKTMENNIVPPCSPASSVEESKQDCDDDGSLPYSTPPPSCSGDEDSPCCTPPPPFLIATSGASSSSNSPNSEKRPSNHDPRLDPSSAPQQVPVIVSTSSAMQLFTNGKIKLVDNEKEVINYELREAKPNSTTCANASKVKPKSKNELNDATSMSQVLRFLHSCKNPEDKLTSLVSKYVDINTENKKLQRLIKEKQKQCATLQKEMDQLHADLEKANNARVRLENLCRELQKQNKAIKEESAHAVKIEEEKHKEMACKFQHALNDITALMKDDSSKTLKLHEDNQDMNTKLQSVYQQYEQREQHVEKMQQHVKLEAQLCEAKIAKAKMEMAAEKEIMLREKQQLLVTLTELQARCKEYQSIEGTLRSQVAMYGEKYEEFQTALARSNSVFTNFKQEMAFMTEKIAKLEGETSSWKSRWEMTQKALLEMATDKQKSDQEVLQSTRQLAALNKLCHTLQSERTKLLECLRDNNVKLNYPIMEEDHVDGCEKKTHDCSKKQTMFNGKPEPKKTQPPKVIAASIGLKNDKSRTKYFSDCHNRAATTLGILPDGIDSRAALLAVASAKELGDGKRMPTEEDLKEAVAKLNMDALAIAASEHLCKEELLVNNNKGQENNRKRNKK